MAALRYIAITLAVLAGGFFLIKLGGAYIDINGIESDLNGLGSDLLVECIGDPYCEEDVIDQIEMVREFNNRQVDLDYDTLDYAASSNLILVEGSKDIDFLVKRLNYKFTVEVEIWR